MRLVLNGWRFEGDYGEPIDAAMTGVLESLFPAHDSRAVPLMAAIRSGNGLKFGQVPELLERFKVPFTIID